MTEIQGDITSSELLILPVEDAEAGTRLDVYLAARIPAISRARLQRIVEDESVMVNDRVVVKPSYKVRAGETIEIDLSEPAISSELIPEDIALDVIYEDEDLIVVNKPAGLVVHPGAGVPSGTLANALTFHFSSLSTRGGHLRPGIVHRLDRDTSGLMVVAKSEAAHENLSDQFRARTVFKSYVALVHGSLKTEGGRIEDAIGRDPRHRTRMAIVKAGRGGRTALSLYRVRERFTRFTLLNVEIKTGRTHQIRVHLAHIRHPVVGDESYDGGREGTIPNAPLRHRIAALKRQFLHAEQLAFEHPRTGERLRFIAPLPADLADLLTYLRETNA